MKAATAEQRLVKRLQDLASSMTLIPDSEANWLLHHRPSVAIVQCVGSGPWRYPRRAAVQAHALAMLGSKDLNRVGIGELDPVTMFPLDWQRQMLDDAGRTLRALCRRFDTLGRHDRCTREFLESLFNYSPLPKVLCMYVRDYLHLEAFPIDRHVRDWLKANKLPVNEHKILELCASAGVCPRALNRGIFGSKSENPVFPVQ